MTKSEYEKGKEKVKKLLKNKDNLSESELEESVKLITKLDQYEREHRKDKWKRN